MVRSPLAGARVATDLNELSAAPGPATPHTNPAARAYGPTAGVGCGPRNREPDIRGQQLKSLSGAREEDFRRDGPCWDAWALVGHLEAVAVVAHEVGHGLQMDHNEDENDVMYHIINTTAVSYDMEPYFRRARAFFQ